MRTNKYGQIILDREEIFTGLYSGKLVNLDEFFTDDVELVQQLTQSLKANYDQVPGVKQYTESDEPVEIFDQANQSNWYMPEQYKTMDIEEFLVNECPKQHYTRLIEELELFRQHNMIDLLKYLKYLVDTMREQSIVWGVGRGSSVASYCLYLIGVHKIDSIKYELDIREFLR
jgi:DNA polymerase III alpha subunit